MKHVKVSMRDNFELSLRIQIEIRLIEMACI